MISTIRTRPLIAAAVTVCGAHVADVLLLGPVAIGSLISNLLQLLAGLIASWACLQASRGSSDFPRRFWTLAATAFAIWSLGQVTYAYHENWLGSEVPRPSWTHFLFRLYGAPLLMALVIGPDEKEVGRGPDWQHVLDSTQVGIVFLFFYFDLYFVPGTEWQGLTGLSLWGFFRLSDVENWLLCAAFLGRAHLSRRFQGRALFGRLGLYLLAYAASSTLANYHFYLREGRTGQWPDLMFTFSLTLGSLLAATWRPTAIEPATETDSIPLVNWVPATLPLITLAMALPVARRAPDVAFVAVIGSVLCFGARLVITLNRRQRLMEELKASETRYARLVQLAPDAIVVHAGGRITFANPATARTLGFESAEELVGRPLIDFVPPEQREAYAALLAAESVPEESIARRLNCVRRDGVRVPVEILGTAFGRAGGSGPTARLLIARDVTARERAEAERERLILELGAKNAELERFTYTVSHDLRSPLITITGFLSHVEQAGARGDTVSMRNDIERIRSAAKRMERLLGDLLELSRVGHILGARECVQFEPVCQEAVDLVTGRLRGRGVTVEIDPGLPEVFCDRPRLVEVLQNLLDNAAKFMGDQMNPTVRIGARKEEGSTVLFVRDNGIGIEPRHHERVFRLFDRLDPKSEGTGVGLALVKRIIELHGGRIWVESEAGQGATFCFTLASREDSPAGAA